MLKICLLIYARAYVRAHENSFTNSNGKKEPVLLQNPKTTNAILTEKYISFIYGIIFDKVIFNNSQNLLL